MENYNILFLDAFLDGKGHKYIAKNLIKIEQNWLKDNKKDHREIKQKTPYNQLDIDSLVNQINQDSFK